MNRTPIVRYGSYQVEGMNYYCPTRACDYEKDTKEKVMKVGE